MRNYELMIKEYLDWLKMKDSNLEIVKSNVQSVLSMDNDQEISRQLKSYVLKRIQQEPDQVVFNRLLIWLFIQDKNFTAAIRQSMALDRRTNAEDGSIFGLANVAASNKNYEEAAKAYDYIIAKGRKSEFFSVASLQRVQMQYERFVEEGNQDAAQAEMLRSQFKLVIENLGINPETTGLLSEYAHLLAFYLRQPADGVKILNDGLALPGISLPQISILKAELADVYVYSGDLWEAVITYSQVIESNKSTPLGDDVKFKKARLGYYMGNFQWAKAQLDALRASTSKLIANDAMELSLFIGENLETDSTTTPLQMFARADLQLFRNNYPEALASLDSINKNYAYNSLSNDVNYRKAGISQKQGRFAEAAALYETIVKENSWDMLADDALFRLAGLYQNRLNRKPEAMELYKKMLTDYPGSVYVVDSRSEYRKIQEELKPATSSDSSLTKPAELTRP
jgi:tetratricopeptide (TPR) repeat protein